MNDLNLTIQEWINLSFRAPSGGNLQPWDVTYSLENNDEVIINLKVSSEYLNKVHYMDYYHLGGLISLGCLSENIINESTQFGFEFLNYLYFDISSVETFFIGLRFSIINNFKIISKSNNDVNSDFHIRKTYRGEMKKNYIDEEIISKVIHPIDESITFLDYSDRKESFLKLFKKFEHLRCKNKFLLNELLHEISVTKDDDSKGKLPLSTLGIPKISQFGLKLIANFSVLKLLFKIGFNYIFVYDGLVKPVKKSPHVFIIQSNDETPIGWFKIGSQLMQSWNLAFKNGLAMQPFGLPILAHSILNKSQKKPEFLSASIFEDLLKLNGSTFLFSKPTIAFRMGYPKKLSHYLNLKLTHRANKIIKQINSKSVTGKVKIAGS